MLCNSVAPTYFIYWKYLVTKASVNNITCSIHIICDYMGTMRARYGVSVMIVISYWSSTTVVAVSYVISWYIRSRHNDAWLCLVQGVWQNILYITTKTKPENCGDCKQTSRFRLWCASCNEPDDAYVQSESSMVCDPFAPIYLLYW